MLFRSITSASPDKCLEYCETKKLSSTNYGTFIRALVYTMKSEYPVEIINNENKSMIKAQLTFFSIEYTEGKEGNFDRLHIEYRTVGEDELRTLEFERIGKPDVLQDRKSGARTFYRYDINPDKTAGYRFTFNRRISKA